MKLGDLLNKLAAKIGSQNDQDLIDLLSSAEIAHVDVSDELAQRFDTGLMSLDGAKNNRDVLNHLKPIILKAADDTFAILAEKYGIANEMQAEQSTYKKIDLLENALSAKMKDLEQRAQSASATKGEEASRLTKQIEQLQNFLQLEVLKVFLEDEINITYMSSHPSKYNMDEYGFIVNFDGHIHQNNILNVINKIKPKTTYLRFLGSYEKNSIY